MSWSLGQRRLLKRYISPNPRGNVLEEPTVLMTEHCGKGVALAIPLSIMAEAKTSSVFPQAKAIFGK